MDLKRNYASHHSAIVDEGAQVGEGTKIWHFSHVTSGAIIGSNCSLGQNVYVAPTARLGNNVRIQNNVSIYDQVILEDDVFCGPSCVFTNVINPRAHIPRKHEYKKTIAQKGATIGANATIVCGVTLGSYCFVAAGAVVTKNIKPFELVGGVPARHMGWMCKCGNGLSISNQSELIQCKECGQQFQFAKGTLACLECE